MRKRAGKHIFNAMIEFDHLQNVLCLLLAIRLGGTDPCIPPASCTESPSRYAMLQISSRPGCHATSDK